MLQERRPIKPPPLCSKTRPFFKFNLLFVSMASLFSFAFLLSLFIFFTHSSATRHNHHRKPSSAAGSEIVGEACNASRDPPTCKLSLTKSGHLPPNPTVVQVIQSAINVSLDNLKEAQPMVNDILEASTGNLNRTNACKTCMELLGYSAYRMKRTAGVLRRGKIKDARVWMGAALAYQYDCWSSLKYVNGTSKVSDTMSFLNSSIGLSSNALSMMWNYNNFGEKTGSWGLPKTERDGFWESITRSTSKAGFKGGVPRGLKANVTVCKDQNCNYKTVQEAVDAAPRNVLDRMFVIAIKTGVYEETVRVPLEKKHVVFLGDGMAKTVITGSMNVGQPGMSTYNSATVGVVGDGFMATNLTIQNTAGPDAHQAVAFRSDSDRSVVENCEFIGNQDTLYAHSLRQYYKSCRIQGNVDFIFGNSAAFFEDCLILLAPRQLKPEKCENNAVTAHGRIDPGQSTGFVFQNCRVNGTDRYMDLYYKKPKVHKNFLGRPWKEYSRTAFIECRLEALISPTGWMPWSGEFALKTLYYGEFQNTGLGAADTSSRVPWSSQIPAEHVNSYSVQSFIQGDEWIPTFL